MKYRDPETGKFKELYTKAADTLPVGTVVDYDGDEVPAGWEEVEETDNYSTEETFTGKYWIDGKKIYRKVINVGTHTFSNGDNKFAHGISNLETVLDINYSMFFVSGNQWYMYWNTIVGKIATSSDVILSTNGSNTFSRSKIAIEYT